MKTRIENIVVIILIQIKIKKIGKVIGSLRNLQRDQILTLTTMLEIANTNLVSYFIKIFN